MPCAYHFSPLALALLFCRIFPFCSLGKRLTSVLDISDNQLLLPSQRLLTTNFFWPKSRLQWQVKFIQVHTSSTFATSWKVCLAVKKKKVSKRQRSRALSFSFWREFRDVLLQVRLTPAGHAVCGCPSFIESCELLSLCSQSFSIFKHLSHYSSLFWNFPLFIIHFRIFDYSLFLKATTPLFVSIISSLFIIPLPPPIVGNQAIK